MKKVFAVVLSLVLVLASVSALAYSFDPGKGASEEFKAYVNTKTPIAAGGLRTLLEYLGVPDVDAYLAALIPQTGGYTTVEATDVGDSGWDALVDALRVLYDEQLEAGDFVNPDYTFEQFVTDVVISGVANGLGSFGDIAGEVADDGDKVEIPTVAEVAPGETYEEAAKVANKPADDAATGFYSLNGKILYADGAKVLPAYKDAASAPKADQGTNIFVGTDEYEWDADASAYVKVAA